MALNRKYIHDTPCRPHSTTVKKFKNYEIYAKGKTTLFRMDFQTLKEQKELLFLQMFIIFAHQNGRETDFVFLGYLDVL